VRKPWIRSKPKGRGTCRGDSSTAMCLQLIDAAGWIPGIHTNDEWIDGLLAGVLHGRYGNDGAGAAIDGPDYKLHLRTCISASNLVN